MSDKDIKKKTIMAVLGLPLLVILVVLYAFSNDDPNQSSNPLISIIIGTIFVFIVLPMVAKKNESVNKIHLLLNSGLNNLLALEAFPLILLVISFITVPILSKKMFKKKDLPEEESQEQKQEK